MIHYCRIYNVQLSGIAKRTDTMTRNGLTRLEDQDQTPLLYISASPQKEGHYQRLTFRKTSEKHNDGIMETLLQPYLTSDIYTSIRT